MNVGSHKTHQSKPFRVTRGKTTLDHQTVIPPHSHTSQTITRLVSTEVVQGSRAFVQPSSRTSNSIHSCRRAPERLSNQGSRTSNSTHQGLQITCPTKAYRASNSTQVVPGLLERFSNQGFQKLVNQPTTIRNMSIN